jgi:hypothetical protein
MQNILTYILRSICTLFFYFHFLCHTKHGCYPDRLGMITGRNEIHFQSEMLYFRSFLWYFKVFLFCIFLAWWFHYSYLNNVEPPIGYVACFLNFTSDVISVICRLHNLWSSFKIPFYSVPLIVFSFRTHAFVYLWTICRFS